jgi:signal transduction histidine kinase
MEEWESLLEELREEIILRENQLEFLHEIDVQLLESKHSLNPTFDYIITRAQELLKSDLTAILLRRGGRLETAYSSDKSVLGQHLAVSSSLTGETLDSTEPISVADVTAPPYADKYIPIDGYTGPPLRSLLAAPIRVHETMVGVLSTESTRVGAFRPVHERIITAIAGQIAIALQRVQLFEQDKLFSEVDSLLFAGPESMHVVSAALQKVLDALQILEHVQLSAADIMFLKGSKELEVVHSTSPADVGLTLPLDQSICGRAVRLKQTVSIGNVEEEEEYLRMLGTATKSEMAIPILLGNSDLVIGVLNVESEEQNAFEGFSQVILESFADKVRTLLAFAKLRADVTETMELRTATDLLVAVGDQASNMIHRMNNTVGAMRWRILELQELMETGKLGPNTFLDKSLTALKHLADQTLEMPEEVTRLLNQQGVTVDVNQVVREVVAKTMPPENVELILALDPATPPLSLFSFDIVVQNLVQNALDAMPHGGQLKIATASTYHPDMVSGYVNLTVTDTGSGISPDVLPRLFELNFTTKHTKGKGHGLGLWWIRNFVLRSNGDITVSSSPDEGSEFVIKIPIELLPDEGGQA